MYTCATLANNVNLNKPKKPICHQRATVAPFVLVEDVGVFFYSYTFSFGILDGKCEI